MELKFYMTILRRRLWLILLTMLVASGATAWWSYSQAPSYKASVTVWVPTTGDNDANTGDIQLADRLMNTYAELATSGPVIRELEARLGVSTDMLQIDVASVPLTELLRISVTHPNPQLAATAATDLATIMIKQTLATKSGRDRRISLFAPAGVPDTPMWLGLIPTPFWREINIAVALVLSLIAGVALAFFYEYLDSRLYTKEQIEAVAELQTLGEIPATKQPLLLLAAESTAEAEAYRYLRTTIFLDPITFPRTLLVTSAMPGEGKSTIVANLALALAQAKRNVIVVDTDLRLPTIHRLFNLSTDIGLSSVLRQECTLNDALQQTQTPNVRVITCGPRPNHPGVLLDSPQFTSLIDQLRQEADFILFDSPATLAVSDAAVIAPMVDGVLLVVGQAHAMQETVRAARNHLSAVGANLVGLVVNRAGQGAEYFRRYSINGSMTA